MIVQTSDNEETRIPQAYTYNPQPEIGLYEYDWDQWEEVEGLPGERRTMVAGVVNGALIAAGGRDASAYRTNTYRFDGTNWTEVIGMPAPRASAFGSVVSNRLYSVGGYDGEWHTNAYVFDGATWTEVAGYPVAAQYVAAGTLNGTLYGIGDFNGYKTNVYGFDGTAWNETVGMPIGMSYQAVATMGGKLYNIAGYNNGVRLNDVYAFDGSQWSSVASMPASRTSLSAAELDGYLYAMGGYNGFYATNVYRYNGVDWTQIAGLPNYMRYHTSATFNDQIYTIGGYNAGGYLTNVCRYPKLLSVNSGVDPASASWTGGATVVICGTFGNGDDITNVTLCGVTAQINSQNSISVTVIANAGTSDVTGDIIVQSVSYGTAIRTNGFTYTVPELSVLGTNGAIIESGAAASVMKGTEFASLLAGMALTNTFSITNSGHETLTIDPTDLSDQTDQTPFTVTSLPATLAAGAVSNFTVSFAPTNAGRFTLALSITNNGWVSPFALNLSGTCYTISTNAGPYGGGNTITLSGSGLGSGTDITNITIGGIGTTNITSQTADSVTFVVPDCPLTGAVNIIVQSQSQGESTFVGVYTFEAPTTLYVDAAQPGNSGSGAHWDTAKRTIQAAVDLLGDGGMVWVTNGVYNEGGMAAAGYALTNRVCITNAITVRSVNGPAVTTIAGAPAAGGGFGNDAIRGVFMDGGASLIGFTLTNGYTLSWGVEVQSSGGGLRLGANCMASNLVLSGNNTAHSGGGAYVINGGALYNSTLSGNSAAYYGGGAFIATTGSLYNCTVSDNGASEGGGGVYVKEGGTLNNCRVDDNRSASAGGAFVGDRGTLNNNLLSGNTSSNSGGGAYVSSGGTLNNSTLSGNSVTYSGGGAYVSSGGVLNNCIVWGNDKEDIGKVNGALIRYTCASDGITHGVDGCITSDPLLNADYTLAMKSPCYNTGDNTYAPTNVAATDLAGNQRIAWDTVDMGAYELQSRLSTVSGPLVGGNTLTVTNTVAFGTITNVVLGAPSACSASLIAHGPNWFTITLPAATNAGTASIIVQTSDHGDTTLQNAYTYNPMGLIYDDAIDTSRQAVAAGVDHALAIKSDSHIVAWGDNAQGEITVPAPNTNWMAVAASYNYSLGLRAGRHDRILGNRVFRCNQYSVAKYELHGYCCWRKLSCAGFEVGQHDYRLGPEQFKSDNGPLAQHQLCGCIGGLYAQPRPQTGWLHRGLGCQRLRSDRCTFAQHQLHRDSGRPFPQLGPEIGWHDRCLGR